MKNKHIKIRDLAYWKKEHLRSMVMAVKTAVESLEQIEILGKAFRVLLNTNLKRNTVNEQQLALKDLIETLVENRLTSAKHHHEFFKWSKIMISYHQERHYKDIVGNINEECFTVLGELPSITHFFLSGESEPWCSIGYDNIYYSLKRKFYNHFASSVLSFQGEYIKWLELKIKEKTEFTIQDFKLEKDSKMTGSLRDALEVLHFDDIFLYGCYEQLKLRECLEFIVLKSEIITTKPVQVSFTSEDQLMALGIHPFA